MAEVKIYKDSTSRCPVIKIDGHKLIGATAITYEESIETVPSFTFSVYAIPDIIREAEVNFKIVPSSVEDVLNFMRNNPDRQTVGKILEELQNIILRNISNEQPERNGNRIV